jgi:hypothetical protein
VCYGLAPDPAKVPEVIAPIEYFQHSRVTVAGDHPFRLFLQTQVVDHR